MSPLFTDHFENVLVLLIQDEVHAGLFNLVEREGVMAPLKDEKT